jgi:hypothetical protein
MIIPNRSHEQNCASLPCIEASADDLLEFATGRASDEVRERVLRAMNDENHPLSCLVRFRSSHESTVMGVGEN